jgi:K(+)-stimulated pyrophosphate-energized sodium pump
MEIALAENFRPVAHYIGVFFLIVALIFVWRSFYKMRISQ